MSWIEKINTQFTITTGDGKVYEAAWLNASKNVEYNISYFEFKELAGTLAIRKQPRGTRFIIEVYFQGERNLDAAKAFQESAADPGAWTIAHPFYGNILVQPSSLTFDNFDYNVTKISGDFIETITVSGATKITISAPDKIAAEKDTTDELLNNSSAVQISNINASETRSLLEKVSESYQAIAQKIVDTDDAASYFNAFNRVNAAINSDVYSTLQVLEAIRDYTSLPYQFSDLLQDRLIMLGLQFDVLSSSLTGLFSRTSKKLYENNAGLNITTMAVCSVTNIGNGYKTMQGVLSTIDFILGKYNSYITNLDILQTANGGSPDSYIPDADAITALSQLVGYTVNVLLEIASNSKQQRIIYLPEDTNLIMLANTLYGLKGGDSVFNDLIESNSIGLIEILGLKKGRKIIYYV